MDRLSLQVQIKDKVAMMLSVLQASCLLCLPHCPSSRSQAEGKVPFSSISLELSCLLV